MAQNVKAVKVRRRFFRFREKKLNRSMAGNALLFGLMIICGLFMVLPLVMVINNALKPIDEIFQFPPRIFVRNPTLSNFSDLFCADEPTPGCRFSRYILNTIIITLGGMLGHVIIASLAAYPLAKHRVSRPQYLVLHGCTVDDVFVDGHADSAVCDHFVAGD